MEYQENQLYRDINQLAQNKGYSVNVIKKDTSNDRGIGSHFVDYKKREIEITIPSQEHPEVEAILVHELLHAELFLNGYPRILRSPDYKYTELDEVLSGEIEDRAHHFLMYPKMRNLGYMHDIENKKYLESRLKNLSNSQGPNLIINALHVLEMDLRDNTIFAPHESTIEKEYPDVYALYRRFKRYYSLIKSQKTMRETILKVFREIENIVKKEGGDYHFKYHFVVPPIPNDYEKKQICTKYYKVVKFPNLTHFSILDKATNQCVRVFNSKLALYELEKMINEMTVGEFFNE